MTSILTITAKTDNKTVNVHVVLNAPDTNESAAMAIEAQKIVWVIMDVLPAKEKVILAKELLEMSTKKIENYEI